MGTIIIITGLPGTGKSSLAESIAKKLKIPIFSVDPIESSIIKTGIKRSFETGLSAYYIVETLAAEQLKLGLSVIIDAVSPVKEARELWNRLSNKYKVKKVIIECTLDKNIHKKRIESRIRNLEGIPEVSWKDVENRVKEYLKWNEKRLIIDTSKNPDRNLKKSLDYIKNRLPN